MKKQEWVDRIDRSLSSGQAFAISYRESDKASLLFACDVFRRRMFDVRIRLEASADFVSTLTVSISPLQTALSFTVKRDDTAEDFINKMVNPEINCVTIRGCGTVINIVCNVVGTAIHNGWYIEKTHLHTLTQQNKNTKQQNTTLLFVLRRGSQLDSI
jgi:hypothetical protein